MEFISEAFKPENGGLPKGISAQARIYKPVVSVGSMSNTDDDGYFIYVNEGDKVKVDIKFTLEPSLLSMLLKNQGSRRLTVQAGVKSATSTTIEYKINGVTLFNNDEAQTVIDENGEQLYIELPSGLAKENILSFESVSPATNLGILFVSLEITDYDRSIAV